MARFGLDNGIEHTLGEVGEAFSLARERVRQIESLALHKLRHSSRFRQLKALRDSRHELSHGHAHAYAPATANAINY